MNYKLRSASIIDGKEIWEMLQELPQDENGFINPAYNLEFKDFRSFINLLIEESNGISSNPNKVPQVTYWLFCNEKPIGISKLRLKLNHELRYISGGNIGYTIRPSERGKGHGKKLLELTLDKARNKGMDQVLITCNDFNSASRKTAESEGGVLEKITDGECFYWILL